MTPFKKILLTTDLSANADAAAPYAAELARASGGEIHLAHIFEDYIYMAQSAGFDGTAFETADWMVAMRKHAQTRIEELAAELRGKSKVNVRVVFLQGNPAREIVKYAGENAIDCIVISTHGRTGVSHFFFGSVAERVVRTAACPVLTVKPEGLEQAAGKILNS